MLAVRSLMFNAFFFGFCALMAVGLLPTLALPRKTVQKLLRFWAASLLKGAQILVGLEWEVRGRENLPHGPCIVASKHQSAWETGLFHQLLDDPSLVLKKELLSIPLFGWYLQKTGAVAIDRKAGASALKLMVRRAKEVLDEGRPVVIFPEGTRTKPDGPSRYHPGVAALYSGTGVAVVPVALNSGVFWPRRGFIKRPGKILVEVLPPIAPGLDRKAFMAELESRMEGATRRLVEEARQSGNYS